MPYFSQAELEAFGFAFLGENVRISRLTSIYDHDKIRIGKNSRIDDFCVLSGKVEIGRNVHIAPLCLIAGGKKGIFIEDFAGLAYGVQVFAQSDDYSGRTMTNPTVPTKFKSETFAPVHINRHSIVGSGSVIGPGVTLAEGTSVGALAFIRKSTDPWSIYVGNPAKRLGDRHRDLEKLESQYLQEDP